MAIIVPGVEVEIHPAANIFPLMDGEAFEALKADINENGQQENIVFYQGKLLDGRNRLRACEELGLEPQTCELEPDADPVKFILSLNLHRRHLTPSQLAMVAARARDFYDKQAKDRQKLSEGRGVKGVENLPHLNETGKARDQAGKAVGVSGKSVDFASRVLEKGTPELIKAVDEGRMAVSRAAEQIRFVRNLNDHDDDQADDDVDEHLHDDAGDDADAPVARPCPRGGPHLWDVEDDEVFCSKCKEPHPAGPPAADDDDTDDDQEIDRTIWTDQMLQDAGEIVQALDAVTKIWTHYPPLSDPLAQRVWAVFQAVDDLARMLDQ